MPEKLEYRPGTLIPGTKYQVVQKLGEGGMGTVYEVEDVSVERRFVLKTIHVKYAGHQVAVERFVREAKALGKLEHKNIVQVMTAGVTGDGLQLRYFVMEKLSGHSLRTVLENKGALPLDAACRFMIDLMSALNCAHDAGIVHRDIKPENIFIARDSSGITTLKLLDFGIMTSTGTRTSDRRGFMGTARYAAPEQMSEGHEATPQSDLYSATLVFYELVCGTGPFDDAEEIPQLMEAHRSKIPPRPTVFRRDCPASLEALIMRGLAKNPADRPVDAFAYAEEIARVLQEIRGTAPTPGARSNQRALAPRTVPISQKTMPLQTAPLPHLPAVTLTKPPTPPSSHPAQPVGATAPYMPPSMSMEEVDQRAAESFARSSSPNRKDEPGTMGATNSTMSSLPIQKNRAWIFGAVALALIAVAVITRPMWSPKDGGKATAAVVPAPPPATAAPTASTIPQPKTAPIVTTPTPSASASAAAHSAAPASTKAPAPRATHAPTARPSLPGSGL
ncbi:MAG: protein kinase [Polyangiaceae bacterium]